MNRAEARTYAIVLGKVVSALRGRRSWTQAELAFRVGIGQSTISRIESGQIIPDAFVFRQLAQAFGMSPDEFQATVDRAYRRTGSAASAAAGGKAGKSWWQDALAVAGVVGIAGLAAFAVAALLNQDEEDNR